MPPDPAAGITAAPMRGGTLYTTGEVATRLRVHQRTVQAWLRAGRLTAVRYGRL
jgi:excisionase family DNA binding protein